MTRHDEGGDEAGGDDRQVGRRQHVAVLQEVEGEGAGHGRHGEEERELRRRALVGAEQQRADDGCAGARGAGDHRQALEQADAEADRQREIHDVVVFRLQRPAVDPEQHEAAEDQHDADQLRRLEQHALDEVMGERADDRRRQEGDQDTEHEARACAVARQIEQDLPQPR